MVEWYGLCEHDVFILQGSNTYALVAVLPYRLQLPAATIDHGINIRQSEPELMMVPLHAINCRLKGFLRLFQCTIVYATSFMASNLQGAWTMHEQVRYVLVCSSILFSLIGKGPPTVEAC